MSNRKKLCVDLMNVFDKMSPCHPDYRMIKEAVQGNPNNYFQAMFLTRLRLLGFAPELISWIEGFILVPEKEKK